MKLEQDMRVVTADGQDVGQVDRVVMDPRTKEVSHLVVRKGFLFPEDRVVPMELIRRTEEDQIILREDAGDLQQLPIFEETHYVPVDDYERSRMPAASYVPPMYWYPPYPAVGWGRFGTGYYGAGFTTRTEKNIPEGTVALAEGAKVVSADGQHVGNVEQVLVDPEAERATHFVVSSGLLFKTRKLVPTTWITDLGRDEVHLAVGAHLLEQLREYHPQNE